MKQFLLIFMLLPSALLNAQQAYLDSVYGITNGYQISFSVSDSFLLIGGEDFSVGLNKYNFMLLNKKGEKLDSTQYQILNSDTVFATCNGCADFANFNGKTRVIHALDEGFIFRHDNGLEYNSSRMHLKILDSNLNLIKSIKSKDSGDVIGRLTNEVLVTHTGHILLSGISGRIPLISGAEQLKYDLWVAKFDTALNLVWETFVPDDRGDSVPYGPTGEHISLDAYNSVVVSGWGRYGPNNAFAARLNLDDGSLYWYKAFDSPYGSGGMSVVDRGDGKYVFVQNLGTELSASGTSITAADLLIGLIDTTGQVIQQKRIGPRGQFTGMDKLLKLSDGNFYAAGFNNLDAMGLKFSGNLDSLWYRTYYHIEPEDRTSFLSAAELDGGFILNAGNYQDWKLDPITPKEGIWLLKIDNHGCAYAGCHLVGVPERTLNLQLMAFPNPTTGPFTVDYQSGAEANSSKALSYHIINAQGQLVEEGIFNGNTTYDLSHHPKGIYFFHVFTEGYLVWGAKIVKE